VRRRKSWLAVVVGLAFLGTLTAEQRAPGTSAADTIRQMLVELHQHDEFTGSVLVARDGVTVYRDAIAATPDDAAKLLATPATIASLAKGFTAMTVMMLAERGKLGYDDPVDRHIPELAGAMADVTIRHLLTHTSGIPDVGDLGVDRPGVRERDVVDLRARTERRRLRTPRSRPPRRRDPRLRAQRPSLSEVVQCLRRLGDAFFRAGRRAEAARAYSRALELDPANVNARTMIEKLK
jgi:CubicO group peptidase (beta-lactamase class C family)